MCARVRVHARLLHNGWATRACLIQDLLWIARSSVAVRAPGLAELPAFGEGLLALPAPWAQMFQFFTGV